MINNIQNTAMAIGYNTPINQIEINHQNQNGSGLNAD